MDSWLNELHRDDPWLPLYVMLGGVMSLFTGVALIVSVIVCRADRPAKP